MEMVRQAGFKRGRNRARVFFKEWRTHRGLSQQKLADRMATTKANVSRKENMLEPYDQDYLEALAKALDTDQASLIMRNPLNPDGLWSIWDQVEPAERELIEQIVRKIGQKTGT